MQFCSTKTYHPCNGWYYGLKLHLIVDYAGNIVDFLFTTARTSGIQGLEIILKNFINKDYVGNTCYILKNLQKEASLLNSTIMTKTRKNMKVLATKTDFKRYNKRKIIETAFGSLKENYNLVTSKSRSISGYIADCIRTLFQYQYCKKVNLKLKSRVS